MSGAPATPVAPRPVRPSDMSPERIMTVFAQYDVDGSGDLDTFELAAAVTEIYGQRPKTPQIHAMVRMAGAEKTNSLRPEQFASLVKSFNFEAISGLLPANAYEVEFEHESLGFRVKNNQEKGVIIVSQITMPEYEGRMAVGDVVCAVNGAPMGFVTSSRNLAQKVGPLKRPVTITFERQGEGGTVAPEDSIEVDASDAHMLTVEKIREAFTKFDFDGSGDLDTFGKLLLIPAFPSSLCPY